MILRITRESFFVFTTSSTLYVLRGGLGATLDGGFVDIVALALFGGVGAKGLIFSFLI